MESTTDKPLFILYNDGRIVVNMSDGRRLTLYKEIIWKPTGRRYVLKYSRNDGYVYFYYELEPKSIYLSSILIEVRSETYESEEMSILRLTHSQWPSVTVNNGNSNYDCMCKLADALYGPWVANRWVPFR